MLQVDPPLPDSFPPDVTEQQLTDIAAKLAPDPLNDGEGYPMARFGAAADAERAGLPDAYRQDPEALFKWVADPVLKEVAVAARNRRAATRRAFRAVEQYFGLNREELRRARWQTYRAVEVARRALQAPGLDDAARTEIKAVVREMLAPDWPFAAMVRYFVREAWHLDVA
jgi:hypothetical protein